MAQKAPRKYEMTVITGATGVGKTTLAEDGVYKWIADAQKRGPFEVAILDPNAQFAHLGECAQWPGRKPDDTMDPNDERDPDERAEAWLRAFKKARALHGANPPPCLVVLDDADVYMSGGQPRGIWRDFFMTFRHWKCDVLIIGRRPQTLPKECFTNASRVAIFTSRENYAMGYYSEYIGASNAKQIPRKPYHYLLVDLTGEDGGETYDAEVLQTKRRKITVAADTR